MDNSNIEIVIEPKKSKKSKKLKESKKSSSINELIDNHISNNNLITDNSLLENESNESNQSNQPNESNESNQIKINDIDETFDSDNIDSEISQLIYPKNHGNYWTSQEREFIIKSLSSSIITNSSDFFDEENIEKMSKQIERSEYAIKEEIKKMIFNEFIKGVEYNDIANKFNMPVQNVKLLCRNHIDKHGKRFIANIRMENKILKLQMENLKLKKELREFN
jgi:hypothetical protein